MFYKGFRNKMRFRWQEEHEINIDLIFFRKLFFSNNNVFCLIYLLWIVIMLIWLNYDIDGI